MTKEFLFDIALAPHIGVVRGSGRMRLISNGMLWWHILVWFNQTICHPVSHIRFQFHLKTTLRLFVLDSEFTKYQFKSNGNCVCVRACVCICDATRACASNANPYSPKNGLACISYNTIYDARHISINRQLWFFFYVFVPSTGLCMLDRYGK